MTEPNGGLQLRTPAMTMFIATPFGVGLESYTRGSVAAVESEGAVTVTKPESRAMGGQPERLVPAASSTTGERSVADSHTGFDFLVCVTALSEPNAEIDERHGATGFACTGEGQRP